MTSPTSSLITEGDEIRLDRQIELAFRADWGQANLTRICGWLAQEVGDRTRPGSRTAIWNGRGGRDQTDALAAREVDVTVMTPAAAARLVYDGTGPIGVSPQRDLRALGSLAHHDGLVIAVDARLPVRTVADLSSVAERLVIATAPDDGINMIGLGGHHALRLAGAAPEALANAGARFIYDERPFSALAEFRSGSANVVIQEAVMTPAWQRIADIHPVRYLDWGDDVFSGFAQFGWQDLTLPPGYFPGQEQQLRTLDFSDMTVLCRADLDDDLAYLLTWCLIRTRRALEVQYAHLPPERSPIVLPLDAAKMRQTPVPLHPAAERAYRDLGNAAFEPDAMWGDP